MGTYDFVQTFITGTSGAVQFYVTSHTQLAPSSCKIVSAPDLKKYISIMFQYFEEC